MLGISEEEEDKLELSPKIQPRVPSIARIDLLAPSDGLLGSPAKAIATGAGGCEGKGDGECQDARSDLFALSSKPRQCGARRCVSLPLIHTFDQHT